MRTHIGQVIMSTTLNTAAKVAAIYGGTWEAWGQGRVPVGVDPNDADFNAPNKTGGSKTVTLQVEQIPSHRHADAGWRLYDAGGWANRYGAQAGTYNTPIANGATNTEYTGGGQAHENMSPYQTIYMWIRTA